MLDDANPASGCRLHLRGLPVPLGAVGLMGGLAGINSRNEIVTRFFINSGQWQRLLPECHATESAQRPKTRGVDTSPLAGATTPN